MQPELQAVATLIHRLIMDDPFVRQVDPPILQRAVTAYPQRGGKMLRPALVMWACGALGGKPESARYVAATVELFHTWTLVHDDIIDEDDLRRGKPSVHHQVYLETRDDRPGVPIATARNFGISMAILAGDIQQAWANSMLLKAVDDGVPAPVVLALLRRLNGEINPGLISGEANDVEFELRAFADVSAIELAQMLVQKTGLLLRFAAEAGAMVGLGTSEVSDPLVNRVGSFAEKAGLAFQLRDDVLGMFGDEGVLGKPVGSDLRKGKRTLLFAVALERLQGDDREWLLANLGQPDLGPQGVQRARDLLRTCGALDWVEGRAAELVREAVELLDQLPPGHYRDLLRRWAAYVCQRQF